MIKVLAACGNGMGSSMIIKMKIKQVFQELEIPCQIDHSSVGQARGTENNYDVIFCALNFKGQFVEGKKAKIVYLQNLMSDEEIREGAKKALDL
jgi:PTS system ascorbate-specific IIB component